MAIDDVSIDVACGQFRGQYRYEGQGPTQMIDFGNYSYCFRMNKYGKGKRREWRREGREKGGREVLSF